ncbi:hypothetical protein [Thioalkalivibrio sp. ALE16]|uniref:hypothetical protein n=1 Tax=Thioalkalivibrio sp. ALE16 TaxID=1158172 RepID=UPI00039C2B69|nr:hypothetical protein [Thioalkalivibrio sp. ALE16]
MSFGSNVLEAHVWALDEGFVLTYECSCGHEYWTAWDGEVDEDCPSCGTTNSPTDAWSAEDIRSAMKEIAIT